MSAGMPELGSKISLISKADIRYEGRLFTVDPQECTIALAGVRSYGTEDRETSYPILPQQTVYDYILFRGSDIKDIRVVNAVPIPNDPAIMQMHLPQPQQQNFPPTNQFPIQQGSPMNQFGAFGAMQSGVNHQPTMSQVAAVMKQNQQAQAQQSQSPIPQPGKAGKKNLAPGSGQKNKKSSELSNGIDVVTSVDKSTAARKQSNKSQDSRSGTPTMLRKSPVSDRGNQSNQNQRDNQGKENSRQGQRNNNQRNNQQQQQPRERRDSGRNDMQDKGGYRNQNQRPNQMNNHQQPQQQQQRGYNNNRNNYNGNMNNNPMRNNNNQGGSARMRGPPMHMNNYRQQSNQGTPNQNQNKQTNGPQQQRSKPLKFENEFDFDEANSKFEELRANLAKLKVRIAEEPQPTEQVNGEVEKKDDSGNETSADPEDAGYDKNKSFFDNISCEAVERSKGKTQRTNWREERKINSETFGYAYNRRGNFRGARGGYYQNSYNRGPRPGGYRGGNPNYRPVRNHRNQNIAEGRPNASASNGQQSQTMAAAVAAN